ncbi:sigma-70 family RNA polymerase sigma factor [Priestia megaterium]|uniref:sigma-70 family RNA polymerase sigma factor n=1 Tax=Priestia megaterium TaxID=1404 RepID=UPI002E1E1D20|nr:sigma-70 family RNA polymerase sigma factor [Priestia megaterium]
MTKSALTMLLEDISPYKLLNEEEEKAYLSLAQEGDREARDIMINHNLKLVVNVAKRFNKRGVELEDLIQEGSEGLIVAIERFDLNSGYKFSTYAYYWIMQRIYKVVQNKSRTIRVPVYIHEMINRISIAKEELYAQGKKPTVDAIAKLIGEEERKVKVAMRHMKRNLSLEYEKENSEFSNTIEQETFDRPEVKFEQSEEVNECKRAIFDALDTLSDRAQEVLILRFGLDGVSEGRTLKDVSEIVGISKERVRQIEKKALETLREGGGRTERRRRLREYV